MTTQKKNETTEKKTELAEKRSSRRELFGAGTAAIASLAAGVFAAACTDDDDPQTTPTPDGGNRDAGGTGSDAAVPAMDAGAPGPDATTTPAADASGADAVAAQPGDASAGPDRDIAQLNALLSAEFSAVTAYTAGAGLITNAPMTDPLYALRTVIVDIAVSFQTQHKIHATALSESITSLGGTPVTETAVAAMFKPPPALVANPSIMNVLKFAASAERGAAVAYNQVLAGLEDARFRHLASSIEGDESQHFIVLTALIVGLAGPGPNLSSATATRVVPKAFVHSVGTKPEQEGLEKGPPNYYA